MPAQAVLAPNATVSFSKTGICIGCSLKNPDNLVDATAQGAPDLTTFATLQRTIAVATSATATVKDPSDFGNYPAGSTVGFIIANPKQLLTLDALAASGCELCDIQTATDHTLFLGAVQIPRGEYDRRLHAALT